MRLEDSNAVLVAGLMLDELGELSTHSTERDAHVLDPFQNTVAALRLSPTDPGTPVMPRRARSLLFPIVGDDAGCADRLTLVFAAVDHARAGVGDRSLGISHR